MNRVIVLVVALIAITGLVVWVASGNGHALGTTQGSAGLAYTVTILVLMTSSLIMGWRGSAGMAMRFAAVWLAVGFSLVLGYSYRGEMAAVWHRVSGEVNPAMPVQRSNAEVSLRKADDGHFYADVDINGRSIRMLADTGASMVVLSAEDAERAGIDPNHLTYNMPVSTANGEGRAAEVTLDEVRIGSIVRQNVRAAVSRELSGSLLGMSFFSTLSKVAMDSAELVLED